MVVKTLSLVCGCYEWGRGVGEPDKGGKRANRRPIDVSVFLRQSRTRIPILLKRTIHIALIHLFGPSATFLTYVIFLIS